ncbi:MAG: hypothetical protein U1E66_05620 [Rhodospirillales bacterium]
MCAKLGQSVARTATAVAIVATLGGCAQQVSYLPASPQIRQEAGDVAVVPVHCVRAYTVPRPTAGSGEAAKSGAGQGALQGAAPGAALCMSGGAYGCIAGIPLAIGGAIIGAVGGAVVGLGRGHPAAEVDAGEAALRQAFEAAPADETLADLVARRAGEMGVARTVVRVEKEPKSTTLADGGFETALFIDLPQMALAGEGKIDPEVSLRMIGEGRLVRVADGGTIWSRTWWYRGPAQSFFVLAADDGRALAEDVQAGLAVMAAKIVDDLFVSQQAEAHIRLTGFDDVPPGTAQTAEVIPGTAPPSP